jgi:FSR family fosmidomycin resistance protein-like MFS transporter
LSLPTILGTFADPFITLLGDTGRRRRIMLAGDVVFAIATAVFATAPSFAVLLVAACLFWPASGAFVGLAQATWMDLVPGATEHNMARWVVAGSIAGVVGPLVLIGAIATGPGWRGATLLCVLLTFPVLAAASRLRFPEPHPETSDLRSAFRGAIRAFRNGALLRWLALGQLTDLLQDVFLGYLALYLVDVAGATPGVAGAGVAILTAAALAGDVLLLPMLRRLDGLRYLRWSAAAMLVVYPAFLLAGGVGTKLALLVPIGALRAGWYAIVQGRLYAELPGRGGTALAIGAPADLAGSILPLAIGVAAVRFGFGPAMWVLAVAPVSLLALVPRRRTGH